MIDPKSKRSEVPEEFTWNLADIFESDEAWTAEYEAMKEMPARLAAFRGTLGRSAEDLLGWLRGSDAVMKACQHAADGDVFSVQDVECLGACVNAPVVQINDDFYEDLDEASINKVLDAFRRGETPKPGPQIDRQTSGPEGGLTTLKGE